MFYDSISFVTNILFYNEACLLLEVLHKNMQAILWTSLGTSFLAWSDDIIFEAIKYVCHEED